MPTHTHTHWRKVNDEDIQKVYHCTVPDCKYHGIKVAVTQVTKGRMKIQHRCSYCGEHLEYSHTEVRI